METKSGVGGKGGWGRREEELGERGALLLKQTKTGRADPAWGLGRFPVIGSCRGSGAAVRAERTRPVAAQALRLFHILSELLVGAKCSLINLDWRENRLTAFVGPVKQSSVYSADLFFST